MNIPAKKLLFSVSKKDLIFETFRSSGAGGQNVNKVSSGVRCIHPESNAVGRSTDTRDQHKNKKLAFERMTKTKEFQNWIKMEASKRMGNDAIIKENVEKMMKETNLKIEGKIDGLWKEINIAE